MKYYTLIVGSFGCIACTITYFFPYEDMEEEASKNDEKLRLKINPSEGTFS